MALPDLLLLKQYLRIETTGEDTILATFLVRAKALVQQIIGTPIDAIAKTFTDEATSLRAYARLEHLFIPETPVELASPAPVINATGSSPCIGPPYGAWTPRARLCGWGNGRSFRSGL